MLRLIGVVRPTRTLSGIGQEGYGESCPSNKGQNHMSQKPKIAFQGEAGAYSEVACAVHAADFEPLACPTFEAVFRAVETGQASQAMIPIENSTAGRVSDIHHLLAETDLNIIAEHFMPISHQLMAIPGADPEQLTIVRSHAMALGQCRDVIAQRNLLPEVAGDTAGAARILSQNPDPTVAVIASWLAVTHYGLEVVEPEVQDAAHNTTRFLTMSKTADRPDKNDGRIITSFVFQVRNIPAALYKGLGGFATNGVNMTKLESYMIDGSFSATMFYADIEGHPDDQSVQLALEELGFFTTQLKIVGVYKADPYRDPS